MSSFTSRSLIHIKSWIADANLASVIAVGSLLDLVRLSSVHLSIHFLYQRFP
jgi:hypothetical protein